LPARGAEFDVASKSFRFAKDNTPESYLGGRFTEFNASIRRAM
jgi:hypothetical protein